jgi:hypothetical protein
MLELLWDKYAGKKWKKITDQYSAKELSIGRVSVLHISERPHTRVKGQKYSKNTSIFKLLSLSKM